MAGLNGDMAARAEVMHRFGVGSSTQGDQQAEGQCEAHPGQSVSNDPRSCADERPRFQGLAASRPIKWPESVDFWPLLTSWPAAAMSSPKGKPDEGRQLGNVCK